MSRISLDIAHLRRRYRDRSLTPRELVEIVHDRIVGEDAHRVWIARLPYEQLLAYAEAIETRDLESLPLYGIPFAIKDNIDLAGVPTTAGCPGYAYTPPCSATVVQRLIEAGAIPVGKTSLDQFATGLGGTRTPYGACRNPFDTDYISGGSSSGSAVAVALGQVSFALGTDTAGSGRVPAAFNNLVGIKPSRGLLSNSGVVPACRTLDCVSVFALTVDDAVAVLDAASGFDAADPWSRHSRPGRGLGPGGFRYGVPKPEQREFFGNTAYANLFEAALAQLRAIGGEPVDVDLAPFLAAARLLYDGPWVAERYAAIRAFIEARPQALHPVTRAIIARGREAGAVEAFEAMYQLVALRRAVEPILASVDAIVTPTAGTIYRIAEAEADPVATSSRLGHYTNFMNLLDLAAVALPAGFTESGLPFGITLYAEAFSESRLLALAARFERALDLPLGATRTARPAASPPAFPRGYVAVAVCGAHLSGQPLNTELTERGGCLIETGRTAPHYRLYALPGAPPARPGLVRVAHGGASIEIELWALPLERYGSLVAAVPAPLGIAMLELADGRRVQGFVCEAYAVTGATDITAYGGWRSYVAYDQSRERSDPAHGGNNSMSPR